MELFEIAYTQYKNCIKLKPKDQNIAKIINITNIIFGVNYKKLGWSLNNDLTISHFIIQLITDNSLMTISIYDNKIEVKTINKKCYSNKPKYEIFNNLTDFINIYRRNDINLIQLEYELIKLIL